MPKRDRRRGLSRLPVRLPSQWKAGFPWRVDYRGQEARFLGEFVGNVVSDHGGVENLSRTQVHNLERAAFLALRIVQFENADLVPGSQPAPAWTHADYFTAVKAAHRLLADLGPGRRARDALTLREYIQQAATRTETAQDARTAPADAEAAASPSTSQEASCDG